MSKASLFRNIFIALLVGLVLSRAGCSALHASADRRVENDPETYGTGVVPSPETFGIIGLFLAMIVMSIAAVVFLGLWLTFWLRGRRSV